MPGVGPQFFRIDPCYLSRRYPFDGACPEYYSSFAPQHAALRGPFLDRIYHEIDRSAEIDLRGFDLVAGFFRGRRPRGALIRFRSQPSSIGGEEFGAPGRLGKRHFPGRDDVLGAVFLSTGRRHSATLVAVEIPCDYRNRLS